MLRQVLLVSALLVLGLPVAITAGSAEIPAPKLISPVDGFQLTDIASYFNWWRVGDIKEYELELSRDREFSNPERIQKTLGADTQQINPRAYERLMARNPDQMTYFPRQVLATGTWYWRVRAASEALGYSPWSEVYSFHVNDDRTTIAPSRPLTEEEPLLIMEAWNIEDLHDFRNVIPRDLRDYMAISVFYGNYNVEQNFMEFHEPSINYGINYVEFSGTSRSHETWASLANLEWAFQNNPYCLGVMLGEYFWQFDWPGQWWYHEYFTRLVQLAAKYGKFVIWGDGNNRSRFEWQQFAGHPDWAEFCRQYADYLVFMPKTNVDWKQYTAHGATVGMWLSGMASSYGTWHEHWYWSHAGFWGLGEFVQHRTTDYVTMVNKDLMPAVLWNQVFLQSLAQGGSVYVLSGQSTLREYDRNNPPEHYAGVFDRRGRTTSVYEQYILPFWRGVVHQRLIPSQQAVMDRIAIAVDQTMVQGRERVSNWPEMDYVYYDALYRGTYGMREKGEYYELIPNTGRYYFIPLLPYDTDNLGPSITTIPLTDLQDAQVVREIFDQHYPPSYQGDAFVSRVGETVVIMTTHENKDVTEWYDVPLSQGGIRSMRGEVGPHKYIMAKVHDGGQSLWFQVHTEYLERDTQIYLSCDRQPTVLVQPAEGLLKTAWDDTTNVLHLQLCHMHGAVDVLVQTQPYSTQYYEQHILPRSFGLQTPLDNAVELDPTHVTLKWQRSLGAVWYHVLVATDSQFHQVVYDQVVYDTEVTLSDLFSNHKYYWKVRAVSGAELDSMAGQRWSETFSFQTRQATVAPRWAEPVVVRDWFGEVVLDWSQVDASDYYCIYRRRHGEEEFTELAAYLPRSQRRYVDNQVAPDEVYQYQVRATNSFGVSKADAVEIRLRRALDVLPDGIIGSGPHRKQGAWTLAEQDGSSVANVRAVFPQAIGSIVIPGSWVDYSLSFGLRINSLGRGQFGAIRLSGNMEGSSRYQLLYQWADQRFVLQRRETADARTLGELDWPIEMGDWVQIRFVVANGSAQLFVDDALLLDVEDRDPLAAGEIEIYVSNLDVDFSHVALQIMDEF